MEESIAVPQLAINVMKKDVLVAKRMRKWYGTVPLNSLTVCALKTIIELKTHVFVCRKSIRHNITTTLMSISVTNAQRVVFAVYQDAFPVRLRLIEL